MTTPTTTPPPPEPSEAVRALTAAVMQRVQQEVDALSGIALRDAGLDPTDGWRYDPQRGAYVKL